MMIPDEYPNGNTLLYRVSELEKDVDMLSRMVSRLVWALVTLCLSIAGSTLVFVITTAANK